MAVLLTLCVFGLLPSGQVLGQAPSAQPIEKGYRDVVSAYCQLDSNRTKQLVMFGLTSDGGEVDVVPLMRTGPSTAHSTVTLQQPGLELSITKSCKSVVVSHNQALTTFDPTQSSAPRVFEVTDLKGGIIATDKGYGLGFTTSQVEPDTQKVTCVNLQNGTTSSCTDCENLRTVPEQALRIGILEGGMWAYAYNTSHVLRLELGPECVKQDYVNTNVGFASDDIYSLENGGQIMSSAGVLYDVSRNMTTDLLPSGSFTGVMADDKFLSVVQYNGLSKALFAIRDGWSDILCFSWPFLNVVASIGIPSLCDGDVCVSDHTPLHVIIDNNDTPYSLFVVARYSVGEEDLYGLSYIKYKEGVTEPPESSMGSRYQINDHESMQLFDVDDYDHFDMCSLPEDSDTATSVLYIVAYKNDVIVFFNIDYSWARDPIRLPLPVQNMAFEPQCSRVVFAHRRFLTVMTLTDANFYTIPTHVETSLQLIYNSPRGLLLFAPSTAECLMYSVNLWKNVTRRCTCDTKGLTQGRSSRDGQFIYTVSSGSGPQLLSKYAAPGGECASRVLSVELNTSSPILDIAWVNPQNSSIALSSGEIFETSNLTSLGYLFTAKKTSSDRYLSFTSELERLQVVAAAEEHQQYLTIYSWPERQPLSNIYVPAPVCGSIQPLYISRCAKVNKIFMVAAATQQDGTTYRAVAWVDRTSLRLGAVQQRYRQQSASCKLGYTTNSVRGQTKLAEMTTSIPWWRGLEEWPATSPQMWKEGGGMVMDSSSEGSVHRLFNWGYVAGVLGGCVLAVFVVVGLGLVLGFLVCRKRPQSIMTTPLIDADSVQAARDSGQGHTQLYQGQPYPEVGHVMFSAGRSRAAADSGAGQVYFHTPQATLYTAGGRQMTSYGTPQTLPLKSVIYNTGSNNAPATGQSKAPSAQPIQTPVETHRLHKSTESYVSDEQSPCLADTGVGRTDNVRSQGCDVSLTAVPTVTCVDKKQRGGGMVTGAPLETVALTNSTKGDTSM